MKQLIVQIIHATREETLQAVRGPQAATMQKPNELPQREEATAGDIWKTLLSVLPDAREQRLAYLLFHCGLSPHEIMRHCPQDFSDVSEIYRLRCKIMERVLLNASQFSQWLVQDEEK